MKSGLTRELLKYTLYDNAHRMSVTSKIKDEKLGINKQVRFLIDTGATSVIVPASILNINRDQEKIIKSASEPRPHSGIVLDVTIDYYRYVVSEFRIGKNILIKDFPIFITFDNKTNSTLLGMQFLKLFSMVIIPDKRILMLQALRFTEKIVTGQTSARNIGSVIIPQLEEESILNDDDQTIEAYQIHQILSVHDNKTLHRENKE